MSATAESVVESSPKKALKQKSSQQNSSYIIRRRNPQKFQKCDSVLYVSNKTHIKAVLDKCEKLLAEQENEITLYCLGAAIQKGINIALQVSERYPTINLSVNTLTTELIDDLEPLEDDFEFDSQKRQNSALQIQLIRTNPIDSKQPINTSI